MSSKVMMMVMVVMVMLAMPVSPRPHQVQQGMDKIDNAVSESLKEIQAAIMGSAKMIKSAIEETVLEKMSERASRMEQHSSATTDFGNSAPVDVNAKNTAVKYTLAKIIAARKAAALKGAAAAVPLPNNAKVAEGNITTTSDPLAEYCKEACEAGVGGPECDCPDHPIG